MARPRLVQMPASLLGRTNLTLTISAALISIVSTIALYTFVIDPIAEKSADDEAALLVLSAQTWVELPPEARPFFELELAQNHDLIISQVIQELPEYQSSDSAIGLLVTKLEDRLFGGVTVLDGDDLVWVELSMGGYEFQIGVSPDRQQIQPLNVAIVIVGLGAGIVFFTSLLVVQRVTKPLVKISKQAERFRGDENIEPLPETGPRELISLARNFNTMAADISRLLANRTTLMAGISHDLRTPLTRMRLSLELLPEEADKNFVESMNRNILSMEELVTDALSFAKGTQEQLQEVSLGELVSDIVDSFDSEIPISSNVSDDFRLSLAINAFTRVVVNLISNAMLYGDGAEVVLDSNQLRILDYGPGIPENHKTQIFEPFFRLDQSRSALTAGSGLGLAIVSQLCSAHEWSVTVENRMPKGSVFCFTFGD